MKSVYEVNFKTKVYTGYEFKDTVWGYDNVAAVVKINDYWYKIVIDLGDGVNVSVEDVKSDEKLFLDSFEEKDNKHINLLNKESK